ncbi:hypothetical protein BX616_006013 [Lobosporangium transversale]|uniref:F-box domain-containing protein n=1 Tax=Lobosporangium transversale TaxID=64571 RepID=A0A1Y2GY82_9FUNG|nr:hypothetical protein BCR41DRAFT_151850 [Lobosporangium transversale]KAF9897204.1 hypothetical protein BX616_006013 [Lobosporangium transversale]ORZ27237.1 hypothetical protein BCR41DRAFT_151850 [Lobosporangium transversale]|eukprot:XP_021884964.1 hypothetical protein BCR41DRAFT_151850 [Lobosporangium transversale]
MHAALHLEEVRVAIGKLLNPDSLIACACCCREWHDSFIRLLWHSVVFRKTGARISTLPPLALLERHKHLIQYLTVNGCNVPVYLSLQGCSLLTNLTLQGRLFRQSPSEDWLHYWTLLISNHSSTLQTINVHCISGANVSGGFCSAIASCCRLEALHLEGLLVPQVRGAELWDACRNIKTLTLCGMQFPKWDNTFVGVSRLRRLIVKSPISGVNGLEWIQHCPELRSLHWQGYEQALQFPRKQFVQALVCGAWPHLEELHMDDTAWCDESLGTALEGIRSLVTLRATISSFGPLSMRAIEKHSSTVVTLDLTNCLMLKGPIIQKILSSMTALKYLSVGRIGYMDVVRGSPWASVNLQELTINIDMSSPRLSEHEDLDSSYQSDKSKTTLNDLDSSAFTTHQKLVYSRIASLTKLRVLHLKSFWLTGEGIWSPTLDLTLSAGLDYLSPLKELWSFSFMGNPQKMGMEEIEWMAQNWPRLAKLTGRLSTDPDTYYEMKRLLNSHRIQVFDIPIRI